ncbi:MAG: transglutaminase domain-containing protein [Bacteroidota bacterium]
MLLFTVTLIVLFFYNKNMYDNRYNGYLYTDAVNYNELYFSEETYRIKGLKLESSDSLTLNISPVPQKTNWKISYQQGQSYVLQSIEVPTIKLNPGINTYTLTSEIQHKSLKTNVITVEYNPNDNYTFIVNSTLPLIDYQLFSTNRWTKFSNSVTESELQETKKIIAENIKLNDTLPTTEKIKLISSYLVKQLSSSGGAPFGNMKQETPLTQYKIACSKQNKVDCAIYTDVFHLFANCAGIPTRKIGVAGWMDYIGTSGHVFNECYIKEQGKWAFVDLTSKKTMVVNANNEVLNSVDLLNAINANNFEGKQALVIDSSFNIDTVNYTLVNQSEIDYLKPAVSLYVIKENINENMAFKESFKEYLSETSHYGTYYINTIKVNNRNHYYKLFVYKASLGLLGLWCLCIAVKGVLLLKKRLVKS